MGKKKPGMTPEEQSKKFEETVRELVDAGELNPTEAAERFERLTNRLKSASAGGPH